MLDRSKEVMRLLPYIVFALVGAILFFIYQSTTGSFKDIILNILSDTIFFFIAFIFFDVIRSFIRTRESRYLDDYIKNKISNDIFVALYFQKKIIHGYNLDTNTISNVMGIINYSQDEIKHMISNQRYLGFQIFKNTDEVRSLFDEALNHNLILKYSTHIEAINLLRISNNLSSLEIMLKNENNYNHAHPKSTEFMLINGKEMNPNNPEGYLLLRKAPRKDTAVVYDSGVFEKTHLDNLLSEFVLKDEAAEKIAHILYDTLTLMKAWIPEVGHLHRNENRFRIIKQFFSPSTKIETKDSEVYVADIIRVKKR